MTQRLTRGQLAHELSATHTIGIQKANAFAYAPDVRDNPDLYDADTQRLTEAGADEVRARVRKDQTS